MALTKIDGFTVDHPGKDTRTVRFSWGDLTQMAPADAVDVLVVPCLPDDYTPTPGSVVGALSEMGVSVEALAKNKAADYRPQWPCWVSQPVTAIGARFKRILVFEPEKPASVDPSSVSAIFRALACFSPTAPVSVATPLVCTGARKASPADVLWALTWAAAHHGSSKTTKLSAVNVVALTKDLGDRLTPTFTGIKHDYTNVFDLELPGNYAVYVKSVKKKIDSKKLPDTVTYRQAVAVCIYTTDYYHPINSVLHHKHPADADYRQMFPLIEAIDSGLWNMDVRAGESWRGDRLDDDKLKKHQVGAKITATGFTSTSTRREVGVKFIQNTLFDINGRTGFDVKDYSAFPESEVLFHRDLTYSVRTRSENTEFDYWDFTVDEIVTHCEEPHHA